MAHILLVEDDSVAASLIALYVERLPGNHRLTTFSTAAQALAWVNGQQTDLFILDIQLPDYRGTELGKQLRSIPEHRFTPILFTTELAGEELSAYREIKCYDFLVKPFSEEQFRQAVSAALEMGQQMAKPPIILRIEQKQFVFEYELKNILYIESFGKQTVIHSAAGDNILSDNISGYSLTRLLELAGPGHLIQCHKSFLINPSHLSRIDKRTRQLWLKGCDVAIPIGEKYQGNLRDWGRDRMSVLIELLLDGALLALCGLSLLGRSRGRLDALLLLLCSALYSVARFGVGASRDPMDFLILPIDRVVFFLFLSLAVLLLNSLWFQAGEGHIFWGTIAQFALYILLRGVCLAGLGLIGLGDGFWAIYGCRLLSILLWLALWGAGLLRWLREKLADGDTAVRVIACNTLFVLFTLWAAHLGRTSSTGLWLPVTASLLTVLVLIDGAVLLWEQRHIQNQQRGRMLEQYLPMVEELVESVRARQHEFNNRMMAVSAAVNTAGTLKEAQNAVTDLAGRIGLDATDRELLKCDNKVISGMLFGKIKQAELRHIHLETVITGAFLHRSFPETGWVELIGILLDNALEASAPDDAVFLRAEDENGALRLTVSNPCRPMSNVELTELFKRGWSTKAEDGRGYGLFNARKLVEQHGGKIIIRNERICDRNYLTIGALIP